MPRLLKLLSLFHDGLGDRCGRAERSRTFGPPNIGLTRLRKGYQCGDQRVGALRTLLSEIPNGCMDSFNSPSGCELFTLGVISPNRVVCRLRRG
jgi:hypothetical protein